VYQLIFVERLVGLLEADSVNSTEYLVDGQSKNILEEDWKFLVILDGCRYDMFKEVYTGILGDRGTLKKAISPATGTPEWLVKIFYNQDCSGIIYINPLIKFDIKIDLGRPKNYFFKVVNAWQTGWDDALGTITPQGTNDAFTKTYVKNPEKRYIIHYMQPHDPYITIGGEPGLTVAKYLENRERLKQRKNSIREIISNKILSDHMSWSLKKVLGAPSGHFLEEHYRTYGRKGVIEVFKNEIKLVLPYVKTLIDTCPGTWLIMGDHGTRLGEWGRYGHGGRRIKAVTEVPWLEIRNAKRRK
jgi:hypothetical protein